MIEIKNVSKWYGSFQVLTDCTTSIQKGEVVVVCGPSGSGKSTMMNTLGCLDRPTRGSYVLEGRDVSTLSRDELASVRNSKIGFIFQSFNLISNLTAVENVLIPFLPSVGMTPELRVKAAALLTEVGLGDRLDHRPYQLSGGEQQRVAIARALANDPVLVIADEPTGNLDERATRGVFQLLRDINAAGTTIIMATHDLDLVKRAECRTLELNHGALVFDSAAPGTIAPPSGEGSA